MEAVTPVSLPDSAGDAGIGSRGDIRSMAPTWAVRSMAPTWAVHSMAPTWAVRWVPLPFRRVPQLIHVQIRSFFRRLYVRMGSLGNLFPICSFVLSFVSSFFR